MSMGLCADGQYTTHFADFTDFAEKFFHFLPKSFQVLLQSCNAVVTANFGLANKKRQLLAAAHGDFVL
jgi:hypothetical protein